MNYSFFLLPIIIMGFIPFAFADYRGEDYFDVDNGDGSHTWTGGMSPWIPTEQMDQQGRIIYKHYYVSDQPTYVSVQNGVASFVFDKTTCSAKIYDGGLISDSNDFILGSDSYVPKSSVNGSDTWSIVNSVNDAACVTEIIETENSIEVSGTKQSSAGIFKIRYLKEVGKPLKTILEATNLTALTDRKFGITQTQSIPQIITWAGQERDLINYVGETFDRTWLEDNKSKLSNLFIYNGLQFDVIDAWNNIESISVNSVSNGMASISFNYLRNTPILLPNETLIIDPTFSNPTLDGEIVSAGVVGAACDLTGNTKSTAGAPLDLYLEDSDLVGSCYRSFAEYDVSSIPVGSDVTDVDFLYDVQTIGTIKNCAFVGMTVNPTTGTADQIYDNILAATVLTTSATCTTTGNNKSEDLSALGDTYIESTLAQGWAAIGFRFDNETRVAAGPYQLVIASEEDGTATPTPTLVVTYNELEFEVNDLVIENVGDAFSSSGNVTINRGNLVNVTSIVYSVNGTTITTNSTIQNTTSYPTTINFGPFYYQQITDSIYNHTVTVTVQSILGTTSNNTSTLATREYDPDYFTALDPTQGLVNYTFVDTSTINVNRDTSGTVFNIECAYYTQSQAFFADLGSATWDNKSNVIFYEGDASGYYYIACFNDGELFVTGISQNYSNALVPGLLIFDQLGGFFGAPAIILVILAILSLGTGRNYPIVMLIAASVTGILLALELLTLDPGLVVVLIVMTGFGLFGIRKFY